MKNETVVAKPVVPAVAVTTVTVPAPELKPIQTKHLAIQFGMKATQLRRILRSMPEYADGVHTNYAWAVNDPAIGRIAARIKAIADKKVEAARQAQLAIEAKAKADASAKEALNAALAASVKA